MSTINTQSSMNILKSNQVKDKTLIIKYVRSVIEKGTGSNITELKENNSEENLFRIGLYHITTTKKVICEALAIPIEAACRYKRTLEKDGHLVQSEYTVICPYTKNEAHELTTNPDNFEFLLKTNQSKLF